MRDGERQTEPHQAERPWVKELVDTHRPWQIVQSMNDLVDRAELAEAEVARLRATEPHQADTQAYQATKDLLAEVARLRAGLSRLLMYARGNQHVLDLIHELLETRVEATPVTTGVPERTPDTETAYYMGRFYLCDELLRSPLFNRPQREVIEQQAHREMDDLKARGVKFADKVTGESA